MLASVIFYFGLNKQRHGFTVYKSLVRALKARSNRGKLRREKMKCEHDSEQR